MCSKPSFPLKFSVLKKFYVRWQVAFRAGPEKKLLFVLKECNLSKFLYEHGIRFMILTNTIKVIYEMHHYNES